MGETTIREKVHSIARDQAMLFDRGTEGQVSDDAALIADLHFDSLDCVEFVMAIEEEFCIEIQDEDAEGCVTIGDVLKLLERLGVSA